MHPVLRIMRGDKALSLAYLNAAVAASVLQDKGDGPADLAWPAMPDIIAGVRPEDIERLSAEAARDVLAPFVRANKDAPPEALFIHAGDAKVHKPGAWSELPMPSLFAYGLFATTLVYADKVIAENAAKESAAAAAAPPSAAPPIADYVHGEDDSHGLHDVPKGYKPPVITKATPPVQEGGNPELQGGKPAASRSQQRPRSKPKKQKRGR